MVVLSNQLKCEIDEHELKYVIFVFICEVFQFLIGLIYFCVLEEAYFLGMWTWGRIWIWF